MLQLKKIKSGFTNLVEIRVRRVWQDDKFVVDAIGNIVFSGASLIPGCDVMRSGLVVQLMRGT